MEDSGGKQDQEQEDLTQSLQVARRALQETRRRQQEMQRDLEAATLEEQAALDRVQQRRLRNRREAQDALNVVVVE